MSGRKNVMGPIQILTAGSMTGNLVSANIDGRFQDNIGIQVAWSSTTAVGVISVQASVDGKTFYDLTFNPTLNQPTSDSSGYLINLNQLPYSYYRLAYTATSGTGTLNAYAISKEV